jgi:hypothetical protein
MNPESIVLHRITTELSLIRSGGERWVAYLQVRTPRGYEQIDLAAAARPAEACRKAAHKLRSLAEKYEAQSRTY